MVVILGSSIRQEESSLPVLVAAHHILIELVVTSALCIMFEAVKNVCCMEVVDPVQVRFLSIPPGTVRTPILGCVLHRLLRNRPIFFVARVRIGPRKQATAQRICVMYLAIHGRDITNASAFAIWISVQVAKDMLAGTHSDVQVLLLLELVIPVKECMADE